MVSRQQRRAGERAAKKAPEIRRPQPRRIMMDLMPVFVDDEIFYTHVGETVSVRPMTTQKQLLSSMELFARELTGAPDSRKVGEAEDDDEKASAIREMLEYRQESATLLRELILSWDLKDAVTARPLPQPTDPNAFDDLSQTEMAYLSYAVMRAVQSGHGELYDPEEGLQAFEAADQIKDAEARRD